MPWNLINTIKSPAKKGGGGISLSFDSMTGVTLNTSAGWKVYTIGGTSAITRTITATVLSDTTIHIVVCGGGGGSYSLVGETTGCGGGGRFREASKLISALTPTQTFICTIPAAATGNQVGGTSSITFSEPSIGDISCGGGGIGSFNGGNAPANGGGGGGGGYYGTSGGSGGLGVFGGSGGNGYGGGSRGVGGGGGAGGDGQGGYNGGNGAGGAGIRSTLAGIRSVYNTTYFCLGGGGNGFSHDSTTYGGGANRTTTTGSANPTAIIIAIPI